MSSREGYVAVSLNLDSMAHAFGYPAGYEDPAFRQVLDRFELFSDRHRFRYTVYVIGRDLEVAAHRARVRSLARAGHEIANHSWSHHTDLGGLPRGEMEREILRAHDAIEACTGRQPAGFLSPGWSTSRRLVKLLNAVGYRHDSSSLPGLLCYAFVLKNALNHWRCWDRFRRVLNRRDWLEPAAGSREPSLAGDLVKLPVPTTPGPAGIAIWHTTGFLLGWDRHFRLLRKAMAARRFFYYVVHPADLTCDEDLRGGYRHSIERLGGSLEEKMRRFGEAMEIIHGQGRASTTMFGLSEAARAELLAASCPDRALPVPAR